ncbi:MAG: branched-chain amino acid ABC transporter permease, partial [Candidatus Rokuibacteriota bacterium]
TRYASHSSERESRSWQRARRAREQATTMVRMELPQETNRFVDEARRLFSGRDGRIALTLVLAVTAAIEAFLYTPDTPDFPFEGQSGDPSAAVVLVVLAVLPLGLPTFWVSIAVEIFAFALFAASLHLLMAVGGMVSFGHAAYFGLGAYGAALLLQLAGLPMPVAFLGAPLVAALAAALFGYFCVRLSSIYFAMLTLAFAQIVYAVVHQWDEVTGGDNGLLSIWPAPWLAAPGRYYYWALVATLGGIVLLRLVSASPFGLTLRAARDHARRAEAVGVNIRALQWTAFVVAGFVAGLGGAVFAFLKGSVFPVYTETPMSVQPLVMVLLGGVGSPSGPLIGAAVYKLLDTVITRYTDYWQIVLGAILMVLVLALPRGIAGVLDGRRS